MRDVTRFEHALLAAVRDKQADVLKDINDTGALSDGNIEKLKSFIGDFAKNFS